VEENHQKRLSVNNNHLIFIRFSLNFFFVWYLHFNSHNILCLSIESKTQPSLKQQLWKTMLYDAMPLRAKSPETSDHVYMDDFFFLCQTRLLLILLSSE